MKDMAEVPGGGKERESYFSSSPQPSQFGDSREGAVPSTFCTCKVALFHFQKLYLAIVIYGFLQS